jgi:hypothetical protein
MKQLALNSIQELKSNLQAIQPNGETGKLITYILIGVALTAIMVYSYIKQQEGAD